MDKLLEIEISKNDADTLVALYNTCESAKRQLLLKMFECKAHIALGIAEWGDFCVERLGISSQEYARQLIMWARIERTVYNLDANALFQIQSDNPLPSLRKQTAEALAKLSPTQQKEAYREATQQWQGKRTDREIQIDLRKIAERMAKRSAYIAPEKESLAKPQTESPKMVRSNPVLVPQVTETIPVIFTQVEFVQPETYDTGEDNAKTFWAQNPVSCVVLGWEEEYIFFRMPDGKIGYLSKKD